MVCPHFLHHGKYDELNIRKERVIGLMKCFSWWLGMGAVKLSS